MLSIREIEETHFHHFKLTASILNCSERRTCVYLKMLLLKSTVHEMWKIEYYIPIPHRKLDTSLDEQFLQLCPIGPFSAWQWSHEWPFQGRHEPSRGLCKEQQDKLHLRHDRDTWKSSPKYISKSQLKGYSRFQRDFSAIFNFFLTCHF